MERYFFSLISSPDSNSKKSVSYSWRASDIPSITAGFVNTFHGKSQEPLWRKAFDCETSPRRRIDSQFHLKLLSMLYSVSHMMHRKFISPWTCLTRISIITSCVSSRGNRISHFCVCMGFIRLCQQVTVEQQIFACRKFSRIKIARFAKFSCTRIFPEWSRAQIREIFLSRKFPVTQYLAWGSGFRHWVYSYPTRPSASWDVSWSCLINLVLHSSSRDNW